MANKFKVKQRVKLAQPIFGDEGCIIPAGSTGMICHVPGQRGVYGVQFDTLCNGKWHSGIFISAITPAGPVVKLIDVCDLVGK
jgi:hypothetical protein